MNDCLRILMISPQFYPQIGGYERAAERLSSALAHRGHDVTVVAERRNRLPKREWMCGFGVLRIWCIHKPGLHTLTAAISLTRYLLMNGWRYDVYHVHQYGPMAAIAIIMGKFWRRPVVMKLTNSGPKGIAQSLGVGWRAALLKKIYLRVDAVVALSQETAAEALAFGVSESRIHRIHNGVNTEEFDMPSEEVKDTIKEKLSLQGLMIAVSVGRLEADKNLEGLLNAWEKAKEEIGKEWVLVILGEGSMERRLWNIAASSKVKETILFKGKQSRINDWLAASEIYVSSSNNEGLSNSLIEAMSCGLPVVVTRVSGVQELVVGAHAGIDVSVGDMKGLARSLVYLAKESKMRKRMGESGRRVILGRFSIEVVAKNYEVLYSSLVSRCGKG